VRTSSHICAPICSIEGCGQPATERVGNVSVNGDGTTGFRGRTYLCDVHAQGSLRIHHVG